MSRDDKDTSARWLVVSDVDDTLTGDRDALGVLLDAINAEAGRVVLVLNSSRPAVSVDETIASYFPPGFSPAGIVTGLGTEIRLNGVMLDAWTRRFAEWPRQAIVDVVERFGYPAHPSEFQTHAKASFAVPGRGAVDEVLAALAARGLSLTAIYSGESDLDLIAPGAGKDEALRFVADHLRIEPGNVVAAGDSGNDLAMFQAADHAVAVGNARKELLDAAPKEKTFFAKAHHAAGVLEGLRAVGVLHSSL